MIIQTKDLTSVALDWAVAKAVGANIELWNQEVRGVGHSYGLSTGEYRRQQKRYKPSTDWSQCGPLMMDYCVSVKPITDCTWEAESHTHGGIYHAADGKCKNAYLTAACRAIVAAELGDSVDVPDELL